MIKNLNKFKKKYLAIHDKGDSASLIEIQKLSRMKKQYIKRYENAKISYQAHKLLTEDTAQFMRYTNGVGSEVGWFNRMMRWIIPGFIRNCLFGVDIRIASDIHDVEYSLKIAFKTILEGEKFKQSADNRFKENMIIIIKIDKHIDSLDGLRYVESRIYFLAVGFCGSASFWKGKDKPKV